MIHVKVSEDELAKASQAHNPVIGKYESNEVKPSIEVVTKMAEALQMLLGYHFGFADCALDHSLTQNSLTSKNYIRG